MAGDRSELGTARSRPWRTAPAWAPAATFLLAVAGARSAGDPRPVAALGLLGLALAAGGPLRRHGVAAAAGLLSAVLAVSGVPPAADRPVDLVGTPAGEWHRQAFGWRGAVHVERYRQGRVVRSWPVTLQVSTDGALPPPPARRLRLRGYVERRAGCASPGARQRTIWTMVVRRRLIVVEEPEGALGRALRRLRNRLDRQLLALGADRPGVGLARALVLGRRDALDEAWIAGLRRLGLAHVTALSGLHVALVVALALLAARPLASVRGRWLAGAVALVGYVVVAGARPSLLRAAAMTAVVGAGALTERRTVAWNGLALVAVTLVAWRPSRVEDPGFVLSVAATAGLLWGVGSRRGTAPHPLSAALGASLCAQLAGLPWVLAWFRVAQPLAPLWNLPAAPWLALALGSSLLLTVYSGLWPAAARFLLPVQDLLAAPLRWASLRPPDRLVTLAAPGLWASSLLALAALAAWRRRRLPTVACLVLLVLSARCQPSGLAVPELDLLDVGQGEAVLLRHGGEAVLVDGGGWWSGDVARAVTVPALASLRLQGLRAVVMTHPDVDHCRGLWQAARIVPVEEVWIGAGWPPSTCLLRLLAEPGPRLRVLLPGDRIVVAGWTVSVLHPPPAFPGGDNDRSLVLRAEAGGRAVLLAGDLQSAGERVVVAAAQPGALRSDILVVPHHGSRTSTSRRFLEAVSPRLALVSAGRGNRFGHPHDEVLERLRRSSIPRLVTATSGWIRVRFPPSGGLRVETPAAPPAG